MRRWYGAAAVMTAVAVGCGDDDTSTGAGGGGAGGVAAPSCERSDECMPEACGADEAASTACQDGACQTTCTPGLVTCSECNAPSDCTFAGNLCPPPNIDPFQNCFDGRCSEVCGPASSTLCLTDAECPQVRCPGAGAPVAQCLGGGCVDVAARCCTN